MIGMGLYKTLERSSNPVTIRDCTVTSRLWFRDVRKLKRGILLRVGLRYKTKKSSKGGLQIKALLFLQGSTNVRYLLPIPKRVKVVVVMVRRLFVQIW